MSNPSAENTWIPAHPLSSFAASHLPQCVSEQRGGETGFAMNQQTQLQFNLQVPPNPSNLATNFNPTKPSPVVIQKVPTAKSIPNNGFTVLSAEKLALAVRLAKRDLLRSRAQQQQMSPLHYSHEPPVEKSHDQFVQSSHPPPPPPVGCVHHFPPTSTMQGHTPHDESIRAASTMKPPVKQSSSFPSKKPSHHLLLDDQSNVRQGDKTSQEIVRLRKEIRKQMTMLKNLKEKNRRSVGEVNYNRGKRWRGESGRVWREEEEGAVEREQRRKEEHAIRSARMVYNLSQQVESLQKELKKLELLSTKPSQIRHTKKSQAMNRLAATHRAALRTLQSYHSQADQPFSSELALLLQKLSLLSTQLEIEGPEEENEELLRELTNGPDFRHQRHDKTSRQSEVKNMGKENSGPKVVKRIHFVSTKKPPPASKVKSSVLLDSRLQSQRKKVKKCGPPHFAKQTFSSVKRQQPFVPYTPAMHSTPFTTSCMQCKNDPESPYKTPPHVTFKRTPSPSHTPSPLPPQDEEAHQHRTSNKSPPYEVHTQDGPPPRRREDVAEERGGEAKGLEKISAALTEHTAQLEQLRNETNEKLNKLQEQVVNSKNVKTDVKPERLREPDVAWKPDITTEVKMLQSRSELLSLVKRIEEIEAEEDVVRQKWNTITYQDPLLSRPAVQIENRDEDRGSHVSPTVVPPVPSESLSNIEQYGERYRHYLKATGMNTQGGFDPWRVSESLADELLSEAVEQVASELEQLCGNFVENLYSAEFARPS